MILRTARRGIKFSFFASGNKLLTTLLAIFDVPFFGHERFF
jgi:hypothetical protein